MNAKLAGFALRKSQTAPPFITQSAGIIPRVISIPVYVGSSMITNRLNRIEAGRVVDAIDEVAAETRKTVPQIALNWLLQRPSVATVIIGARNEEQLRQNLGSVGWNLTPAQVAKLDAASATVPAYPYWHQRGFAERNPPPV